MFVRKVVSTVEAVSRTCGGVASALLLALIASMIYEVVARYVFNRPTMWAYEISTMLMGASLVLAIGYALIYRTHVRVDFLQSRLPARGRAAIDLIGYLLFLLPMTLWLDMGLWNHFSTAYSSNEVSGQSAWNPKVWPIRLVLFIGFVAFTAQILAEILKTSHRLVTGQLFPGAHTEKHG